MQYVQGGMAQALDVNRQVLAFQNETVPAGALSIGFSLPIIPGFWYPRGLALELVFGGAPGAFQVDLMAADTDLLTHYVSIGNLQAVNNYNVGRAYFSDFCARFAAVQITSLTNSVPVTALLTR